MGQTGVSCPSSGAISIGQIYDVLYGTAASGTHTLRGMSSLTGKSPPDSMSEFYGYEMDIYCEYDSRFYGNQRILDIYEVLTEGVGTWSSSNDSGGWLTTFDDPANDEINIDLTQNILSERYCTITITKEYNTQLQVTVEITQAAGAVKIEPPP